MPQLTLHKQEVAPRTQVSKVTVSVTKKLDARPVSQPAGIQNPHHTPVQAGAFERSPMLVEHQRLRRVGRINAIRQEVRANLPGVSADHVAGVRGNVNRSLLAAFTPNLERRPTVNHRRIRQTKGAEFGVPQP
jgi:hypothetical protein